jgi:KDO2-lipid IV(A) lauroyltransferase
MRAISLLLLTFQRALYRPLIVPLMTFVPSFLAYRVACLNGDLRFRLDRSKREEVMHCLASVLGDQLSHTQRLRIAHDSFRMTSCMAIDATRLAGKGRAFARLVEIRGLEHIEEALAIGKGAIICTAHFGNFNCAISLIGSYGFPITAVGRSAANDRRRSAIERIFYRLNVQRKLQRHRSRQNIEPTGQLGTAAQAAKTLQKNELIAMAVDAPIVLPQERERAVPMDFLNGQALLLPGATTIAKLTGAPVLMMLMRRTADWRHQVLEISPPLSLEGDAVTAYKRCLALVEAAIRQNPSQWLFWNMTDLVNLGLLSKGPELSGDLAG